ncbi:diguanylate cyclase domain-containing protein [Metapseudomonas resinovorans]|uniref:diguanylate cyclase domain-containing protein n=1 Tax=Metapseudomonas resinovorans TaxID=53412 RepID=UPI00041718AE|nr:diguanylate cyclase [Pseudomonas resinovorans]
MDGSAVSYERNLECLVRAIQELSLARDLDRIAEIVRSAARELVGADGATFVLRDGDRCYYKDEDAISPLWKGLLARLGGGEFLVLTTGYGDPDAVLQRLRAGLGAFNRAAEQSLTLRIGHAESTRGQDLEQLLLEADNALHRSAPEID